MLPCLINIEFSVLSVHNKWAVDLKYINVEPCRFGFIQSTPANIYWLKLYLNSLIFDRNFVNSTFVNIECDGYLFLIISVWKYKRSDGQAHLSACWSENDSKYTLMLSPFLSTTDLQDLVLKCSLLISYWKKVSHDSLCQKYEKKNCMPFSLMDFFEIKRRKVDRCHSDG